MMHKNMSCVVVFSACALSFGLFAMDQGGKSMSAQNSPRSVGSHESPRKSRSSSLALPRAAGLSPRLNRSGSLSVVCQAAVAKTMKKTASSGTLGNLKRSKALRLSDKSNQSEDVDEGLFQLINVTEESDSPEAIEAVLELIYGDDFGVELTPEEKAKVVEDLHGKTRLRNSRSPHERDEAEPAYCDSPRTEKLFHDLKEREAAVAAQKLKEETEGKVVEEPTKWTDWQGHGDSWDFEESAGSNDLN